MLVLLLIILGIIFICLSAVAVWALIDDEFREKIESSLRGVLLPTKNSQGMKIVTKLGVYKPEEKKDIIMVNDDGDAPLKWDEPLIKEKLSRVHSNPPILDHLFEAIKARLILGQDYEIGKARIKFLQTQIEELGIAKEYKISLDNLNLQEKEGKIRSRKLEIENRKLEIEEDDLENKGIKQKELAKLDLEKEVLKLELEIAQLRRQKKDIEND